MRLNLFDDIKFSLFQLMVDGQVGHHGRTVRLVVVQVQDTDREFVTTLWQQEWGGSVLVTLNSLKSVIISV